MKHAAKPETPDAVWKDLTAMTVVMEQLRETMPEDERPDFGTCR